VYCCHRVVKSLTHQVIKVHVITKSSSSHQLIIKSSSSHHQVIKSKSSNTSIHQPQPIHINTSTQSSTQKHTNTSSTHQHSTTSTHQHSNTINQQSTQNLNTSTYRQHFNATTHQDPSVNTSSPQYLHHLKLVSKDQVFLFCVVLLSFTLENVQIRFDDYSTVVLLC